MNELDSFLKEGKFDIILLDISFLEESLSVFLFELNKIKRNIGVVIFYNNEFFNFDFNKYKNLHIDFIKKPFLLNSIKKSINKIISADRVKNNSSLNINIPDLERTKKTEYIFNAIIKVIKNDLNVLISGEHGTGKNQIANTINSLSSNKQMLEISYEDYKNGFFSKLLLKEISTKFFLDYKHFKDSQISNYILISNIDAMDYTTQNLLYSALKSKKQNIISLFKNKKIIATTNKSLKNSLRNNNFSNELFYQLDMYNIFTMPLRERIEDIPILVKSFISEYNQNKSTIIEIEDNAILSICNYIWPGNTKQLKNFILKCLKMTEMGNLNKFLIDNELKNEFQYDERNFLENWKINFRGLVSKNIRGYLNNSRKINSGVYYKVLKDFEKPMLLEVLNFTNNNQLLSAEILGINRNTLRKKMADYSIQVIKKTND